MPSKQETFISLTCSHLTKFSLSPSFPFSLPSPSTLPPQQGYGNPGTDSSKFKAQVLHAWRQSLYQRLHAHADRAGAPPKIVAFTGKRQFQELFFDSTLHKGSPIPFGLQEMRPEGFPFTAEETLLFVLTSSSGAAAMSNEAREAPYKELATLLQQFPWEAPPQTTDELTLK